MEEKKRSAAKVVTKLFPRIPKVTTLLLEFYVKRESGIELTREPLMHFCQEEVVLAAQDTLDKLNEQVITYQDMRDMAENLIGLHNLVYKKAQDIAKELGDSIRKLIIIVGELATSLEKVSDVPPTDWMGVGDAVMAKTAKLNMAEIAPFWTFIPKMKDFQCVKLLGAGGFGATVPIIASVVIVLLMVTIVFGLIVSRLKMVKQSGTSSLSGTKVTGADSEHVATTIAGIASKEAVTTPGGQTATSANSVGVDGSSSTSSHDFAGTAVETAEKDSHNTATVD
ncbi:hypothetical protein V5799_002635 [Amblyomma americanum]|uniref:Microtubule-associated serine/threonine-protein kinase pre-PK domain-containing protein n=1 Tax=Amblyomma americanum TaxID=6943 RepID=A0AAQ4DB90_AMBAM